MHGDVEHEPRNAQFPRERVTDLFPSEARNERGGPRGRPFAAIVFRLLVGDREAGVLGAVRGDVLLCRVVTSSVAASGDAEQAESLYGRKCAVPSRAPPPVTLIVATSVILTVCTVPSVGWNWLTMSTSEQSLELLLNRLPEVAV